MKYETFADPSRPGDRNARFVKNRTGLIAVAAVFQLAGARHIDPHRRSLFRPGSSFQYQGAIDG
jgi:hypothetical protein